LFQRPRHSRTGTIPSIGTLPVCWERNDILNWKFFISMKRILILLVLFVFFYIPAPVQANEPFRFTIGEKLSYKVKYSFIRIGTVSMETVDSLRLNSVKVHHVKFRIESNPLLFFLDMNSVFDCYIDDSLRPVKYIATENVSGHFKQAIYNFYYSDSVFTIDFLTDQNSVIPIHKTLPLTETVFDGISMIFFARKNISEVANENVVAFIDDNLGRVKLNFRGKGKPVKIKASAGEISTYYIDGTIIMKGIAGVTGPFKGWFAQDGQRPPIRALLKVFVGNVEVELEKWERWKPQLQSDAPQNH